MNPNPLRRIDIAYVVFAIAPTLRRPPERRPETMKRDATPATRW